MNQFVVFILLLLFFFNVKAKSSSFEENMLSQPNSQNTNTDTKFIIIVVSVMMSLIFIILAFAKFCHGTLSNNQQAYEDGLTQSTSRFSGIDQAVIESLPFFKFSSSEGSMEGLECAVCLSKFEENEILRLLPKCKHAFHISCVDQWLERHSSCPLCRSKVSADDLTHSTRREDLNLELVVQAEVEHDESSRLSIISSLTKSEKGNQEEELLIQESCVRDDDENALRKLKYRWSNVSSSDLMVLNSEMLNAMSSNRFSSLNTNSHRFIDNGRGVVGMEILNSVKERTMSEITVHPRFGEGSMEVSVGDSSLAESSGEEERLRRLWLPIARRTVQWFGNREERTQDSHSTRVSLNV